MFKKSALISWIVVSASICPDAAALNFTPTPSEWAAWPEYCRVRYTVSAAGRGSEYANRYTQTTIDSWGATLGAAWYALHHYCGAIARISRARLEQDPVKKQRLLQGVIEGIKYTTDRTPTDNPMYAEMLVQLGRVQDELGDDDGALRTIDEALATSPNTPTAYMAKAMILRKNGDLEAARDVLLTGDKALSGSSIEIHYFLGLVYFDLHDFESAQRFATAAYEAGYPLPALRDKLAESGHPID